MQFDDENKVILDSMNEAEARAFVLFLGSEIKRHEMDILEAIDLMLKVRGKFKIYG